MVIELCVVQFWSEIILVISNYKIVSIENLAREMQKRSILDVHHSNLLYMGFVKVKIHRTHLSIETQIIEKLWITKNRIRKQSLTTKVVSD